MLVDFRGFPGEKELMLHEAFHFPSPDFDRTGFDVFEEFAVSGFNDFKLAFRPVLLYLVGFGLEFFRIFTSSFFPVVFFLPMVEGVVVYAQFFGCSFPPYAFTV